MSALSIEAPTDAQLAYIAGLCDERGIDPLPVVYSKEDASECIRAILARQYEPGDFAATVLDKLIEMQGTDNAYDDVPF